MIKVFAFDIFGTLVDMSTVPRDELQAYGEHIRKREWSPLTLPYSWTKLDAFDDVYEGLYGIRSNGGCVVTLSNAPIEFQLSLWDQNADERVEIDYYVPLDLRRVYKPQLDAYRTLFELFPSIKPDEICMVTANEHFGDIEAARSLGMKAVLIRGNTGIDVLDLADMAEREEIQ